MFNYTVEFLGTMALILVILITGGNPVIIGAALAGLVAVAGSLSGAHFNPAVSIMALVKYIPSNHFEINHLLQEP